MSETSVPSDRDPSGNPGGVLHDMGDTPEQSVVGAPLGSERYTTQGGEKLQFTPQSYDEFKGETRFRLAEHFRYNPNDRRTAREINWENNIYTREPRNKPDGMYREALIQTESGHAYYITNNTVFKFLPSEDENEPFGAIDDIYTFDEHIPLPNVTLGSEWKLSESDTTSNVTSVLISISRVTGDPDIKQNIGGYKKSGPDLFAVAHKAAGELDDDTPNPIIFERKKPTTVSPETIIERFREVSGSPKGSDPENFLDKKSAELCKEFSAGLEEMDDKGWEKVIKAFTPIELRTRRISGKPVWSTPAQLQSQEGLPNAILNKTVWKGRGIRIGTLDLPRGGSNTIVMLCDDGKLRCLRNTTALNLSYGLGYGELPEGSSITLDTAGITTANDPASVRLQKILSKLKK